MTCVHVCVCVCVCVCVHVCVHVYGHVCVCVNGHVNCKIHSLHKGIVVKLARCSIMLSHSLCCINNNL